MKTPENLEIKTSKILIISTAHISQNDNRQLDKEQTQMFCFHKQLNIVDTLYKNVYKNKEYSEDFIKIVEWALSLGCYEIHFDCDGPIYKDLKVFDWK